MNKIFKEYLKKAEDDVREYFGSSILQKKVLIKIVGTDGYIREFRRIITKVKFTTLSKFGERIFEATFSFETHNEPYEPRYCLFKLFHSSGYSPRPIIFYVPDFDFPHDFLKGEITLL